MSVTKGRYFVKFTVKGIEGNFWSDLIIWDPGAKSLKQIFNDCLEQAQYDLKHKLKKTVPMDSIDIESFSLIEGITEIHFEK